MAYLDIDFKLRFEKIIFFKNKYPNDLVVLSMSIYGKYAFVRIQAKIKGLATILENNLCLNLWPSEKKCGFRKYRSCAK